MDSEVPDLLTSRSQMGTLAGSSCSGWSENQQHHHRLKRRGWMCRAHQAACTRCKASCREAADQLMCQISVVQMTHLAIALETVFSFWP